MFETLIELCIRLAGSHPFAWKLAWEGVHRLTFLLPHDRSYFAFRHFLSGEEGLFLDVGANDGISALSIRKFSKNCNILSLEPNRLHEPALKRLKARDLKFDYMMVGAGAGACTMSFFVPVYLGIVLHTFTSGSRDQVMAGLEKTFGRSVRAKTKIIETKGEVVRIDDLGVEPSIIKIDAEGFDYQILQGARKTIQTSKPFIAIEVAWSN
ncbi:MAG: FkbM family methyltransferase, partial [Proteobacteria bacterium]|nr:FkbM family methyltransferase [Pseudomonadota bacterium]